MTSITLREPLDFFAEYTIPVSKWLAAGSTERHQKYLNACAAYAANKDADTLRCEPHVAYDFLSDWYYFIFKQDNNGTCLIVGERLPIWMRAAFSED